ncbi:MAG: hypothetical protein KME25_23600 [Symplocastrum torsivum CPER-KK1]|uniref:Uncharacterized protein n=1 Tax=Symplocastrum torsivum CPER-KK1 TaxID=450513 RepID=A0A951PPR8_9CYAN|nr:hypothetical protein [Symplocastrum torsivum CPER-KK1]
MHKSEKGEAFADKNPDFTDKSGRKCFALQLKIDFCKRSIIQILTRYTVARFFHRQDAEDHRRFLNRFMPAAEFEVLFDVPNKQLQLTTDQEEDLNQILN